ncbi:MAG: hypothetical protein AAGH46_11555, partial [Bacteroidota bacterium]
EGPVIGCGMIEYDAYQKHSKEICEVEFLLSSANERLVRHVRDDKANAETNSWVFKIQDTANFKIGTVNDENRNLPSQNNFRIDVQECNIHTESSSQSEYNHTNSLGESSGSHLQIQDNTPVSNLNINLEQTQNNISKKYSAEFRLSHLEQGLSHLRNEVGFMKQEQMISAILFELRNEFLLRLGTRWPFFRQIWSSKGEGIYAQQLEVSVGCTLQSLLSIVHYIRNYVQKEDLFAVPSFDKLYNCSLTTADISIFMSNLRNVCDVLKLRDKSDYYKLLLQLSMGNQAKVLQFMGCAMQGTGYDNVSSVNRLFFGSSIVDPNNPIVKQKYDIVFEQPRRDWDDGIGTFASKWISLDVTKFHTMITHSSSCSEGDENISSKNYFRFVWKSAETPSKRKWSADALNNSGDVLGFLTLSVPIVACIGPYTVNGLTSILQDTIPAAFLSDFLQNNKVNKP